MPAEPHRVEIACAPGVDAKWVLERSHFVDAESKTPTVSSRSVCATPPAVEQVIADCLEEHGPNVVRVIHTFGGRGIYLRDGSRIEYRWQLHVSDWRCVDCGVNTDALDEYYMLHNDLWAHVHPDIDGHLCVGCVECRIGRKLTAADFADAHINTTDKLRRSPRLRDRLGSERLPGIAPRDMAKHPRRAGGSGQAYAAVPERPA